MNILNNILYVVFCISLLNILTIQCTPTQQALFKEYIDTLNIYKNNNSNTEYFYKLLDLEKKLLKSANNLNGKKAIKDKIKTLFSIHINSHTSKTAFNNEINNTLKTIQLIKNNNGAYTSSNNMYRYNLQRWTSYTPNGLESQYKIVKKAKKIIKNYQQSPTEHNLKEIINFYKFVQKKYVNKQIKTRLTYLLPKNIKWNVLQEIESDYPPTLRYSSTNKLILYNTNQVTSNVKHNSYNSEAIETLHNLIEIYQKNPFFVNFISLVDFYKKISETNNLDHIIPKDILKQIKYYLYNRSSNRSNNFNINLNYNEDTSSQSPSSHESNNIQNYSNEDQNSSTQSMLKLDLTDSDLINYTHFTIPTLFNNSEKSNNINYLQQ